MSRRFLQRTIVTIGILFIGALGVHAVITEVFLVVEDHHSPQAEHADQKELYDLVASGGEEEAFEEAFELGDELFEVRFNSLDGVGANVGQGQRFSRIPRADLRGTGEWFNHAPKRETGPNAQACNSCHNLPFDDGAGGIEANVHRDPRRNGRMTEFITRNGTHVFGPGALQVLAEEMTASLQGLRDAGIRKACSRREVVTVSLEAKGLDFGRIAVTPRFSNGRCDPAIDKSKLRGVDADLVIKPFQWKGVERTVRSFNRGAAHNELGMQPVETAGRNVDGDGDGVANEMTIGDMTAMAVYLAAQPRPTTLVELASVGQIEPLPPEQVSAISRGRTLFTQTGCDSCHKMSLTINVPIFSEPSQNAAYRDAKFPSGLDPVTEFVDPAFAVTFDLTKDQPDNVIEGPHGEEIHLGSLMKDSQGRAIVELFGDLRRHEMGSALAEPVDETGHGASVWMTTELWGVGSTAPYLHDGRATTLTEAILAHGGEAREERSAFLALPTAKQADIIAMLENLVLFKAEEEE